MRRIDAISSDPKQAFSMYLDQGGSVEFTLEYRPMQLGWFLSVSYGDFALALIRVTTSFNVLSQYSNLIPFGLACMTQDGQEPLLAESFSGGQATLYLLDQDDVASVEGYLSA